MIEEIRCADALKPWDIVDMFQDEFCQYGDIRQDREKGTLELLTGGWSENEAVIEALQANLLFWTLYWQESRRGGHYKFLIREPGLMTTKFRETI